MLPQRTTIRSSSSTDMPILDEVEVGNAPLTRAKVRQSLKPLDMHKGSAKSTLLPSTAGRPRSIQAMPPARQASQPSSRPSSRNSGQARITNHGMSTTRAKLVPTNDPSKSRAAKQPSVHHRSVSQQIGQMPKSRISTLSSMTNPVQQSSLKATKPAFSAMQQHYSPKKRSIPVASADNMTPNAALEGGSDETSELRVELTQLHMMHRTAASVQRQWEESAKKSFQTRFDDLCTRHVELKEIAHQQRTLLNQLALVEWCQGIPSAQVADKVQQVSRNMTDISSLLEPEGKYHRVLELFESWFARARQVESQRDGNTAATQRQDLAFIEGIGDGWKAEAMVLERELTYCLRELKGFGEIRAVSSLGRILSLHKTLVVNLLEELDVIQWIENEIMEHEGTWMEQTINKLSSNVSSNI